MAKRMDLDDGTLGFTLPCRKGQAGCVANVFYHRVESLARAGNGTEWQILGHARVHEKEEVLRRGRQQEALHVSGIESAR
jgi:hypothetical protein